MVSRPNTTFNAPDSLEVRVWDWRARLVDRVAAMDVTTIEKLTELDKHLVDPEFMIKLFEDFTDAIIVTDANGAIQLVNKQAELLFCYPRAELYNQSVECLLPKRLRDQHVKDRALFANKPEARQMGSNRAHLVGLTKDGLEMDLQIMLTPIVLAKGLFVVTTIRQ